MNMIVTWWKSRLDDISKMTAYLNSLKYKLGKKRERDWQDQYPS